MGELSLQYYRVRGRVPHNFEKSLRRITINTHGYKISQPLEVSSFRFKVILSDLQSLFSFDLDEGDGRPQVAEKLIWSNSSILVYVAMKRPRPTTFLKQGTPYYRAILASLHRP